MDSPENRDRLNKIYLQLKEVIKGNLWRRIERSKKKDEMEALIMLVNTMTEEFSDSLKHDGYINFHDSYVYTIQMFILLDRNSLVVELNDGAREILGYGDTELLGTPFQDLLTSKSKKEWKRIKKELESQSWQEKPVGFTFKTIKGFLYPAYCHVIRLSRAHAFRSGTIVTAFELVRTRSAIEKMERDKIRRHGSFPKPPGKTVNILRPHDIEIIRSIGEHLRKHLKERTPLFGDLVSQYKINGFKLKKGFKELYGMTVFQYLKEERLKKAHVLIEHTSYTFMDIAKMVGFRSATHFSREFNDRFGYRPRTLRNATKE